MGLQEFPSKPVNKGGVVVGTINGPTEVAVGAQDSYLVADSTQTPGTKWQTYRKYNTVQLTSGTSWTVPATVESLDVLLVGGGGAATTRTATGTAGQFTGGNAGAGGAILYIPNYPVTPGAAITYSIGAGSNGPAASGVVTTTTYPSAAGNTTFGLLTAPGALNKIGTYTGWTIGTQSQKRGVFDLASYDRGTNSTTDTSYQTSNTTWQLQNFPWWGGAWIVGEIANGASSCQMFEHPANYLGTVNTQQNYVGFKSGGIKLLEGATASQGGLATNELATNTVGTRTAGWAGFGDGGTNTTGTVYSIPGFGAGQGVVMNNSNTAGRGSTGGHAAANSGAGGGAGRACSSGATPIQAGIGGNGGSGVIFIGYWA